MLLLLVSGLSADPLFSLFLPGLGHFHVSDVTVEEFASHTAWEQYAMSGAHFGIENGVYRAYTENPGVTWGLNAAAHSDVVIEVDVTPMSIFSDTAAAVVCRASGVNNGDGYYFMINSNGYYAISTGTGNRIMPLVDWQPTDSIRTGIDENRIRAACIGNQLAMYINDYLVATVQDDRFTAGYTGLAVAAGEESADMAFDDLTIYAVSLG